MRSVRCSRCSCSAAAPTSRWRRCASWCSGRARDGRARGARTRSARRPWPTSCARPARPRSRRSRSTRTTPRRTRRSSPACSTAVGDIDLALLAFGVLGDQEHAEHDGRAAVDIAEVNYVGSVSVAVPIAQRMRTQGHGTIVALSSVAGERARRSNFVYGSSKAGMDAFFQGLGDSLVGTGVRVMIVRPGFVHTKMTDGMDAAPAVDDARSGGRRHRARPRPRPARRCGCRRPLRYVMSVLRHVPRPVFRKLPDLSAPRRGTPCVSRIVDDFELEELGCRARLGTDARTATFARQPQSRPRDHGHDESTHRTPASLRPGCTQATKAWNPATRRHARGRGGSRRGSEA